MKGKRFIFLSMAAIVSFLTVSNAYATDPKSDDEISTETISAISQNCSSIKLQLQALQRNDARMRIYLGQQYETITNKLMTNLNVRLAKNGIPSADLSGQQKKFSSERERFRNDYIGYAQELESLLSIDCKNEPENFYYKLLSVRTKRHYVDSSVRRLDEIAEKHRKSVSKMIEELEK